MSNLLSSLQTASTALQVFTQALGTDQRNVANASTPGYAAQRATILPVETGGEGAENDFLALASTGDSRADAAVRAASSQASDTQTRSGQLSEVNQLFDITGATGILAAFQQFSGAFSQLAVAPNQVALRSNALTAAGNVASAFRSVATSLDSQRGRVDAQIRSTTDEINSLGAQIRGLNVQARGQSQPDPATDANLRSTLEKLSSLVDISVTKAADGTISVLVGGTLPLVIGDRAYSLSSYPSGAAGSQVSSSARGHSPAAFSGQLGALLDIRNTTINQLLGSGAANATLNDLAAGFASRANQLLSSGVTLDGTPGVPIFSFDATDLTNAARTLTLNAAVTEDQLGLAATGATPEANGIANQLAGLPASENAADQIQGLSAEDLFSAIAASVGQQLAHARSASESDQTTLTSAQINQQRISGVSLDQEAVTITSLQRAYQANAQVVTVLNQLTGVAINIIGGGSTA